MWQKLFQAFCNYQAGKVTQLQQWGMFSFYVLHHSRLNWWQVLTYGFGHWQTTEYWLQPNTIKATNSNIAIIFLSFHYTMKFCLKHTVWLPPLFTIKLVCIYQKFFVISSCFRSTAFHQLAPLLFSGKSKKPTALCPLHTEIANPGHLNFTMSTTAHHPILSWCRQISPHPHTLFKIHFIIMLTAIPSGLFSYSFRLNSFWTSYSPNAFYPTSSLISSSK